MTATSDMKNQDRETESTTSVRRVALNANTLRGVLLTGFLVVTIVFFEQPQRCLFHPGERAEHSG